MKINVGSKNKTKLKAVEDAVLLYPNIFLKPEVVGIEVNIEVYGPPKSLKETIEGAMARARDAFGDCNYSIGIESGLMEVPHTKSGYMETPACAIYDGKEFYIGLAPSFEWPKNVTEMILKGEADGSQAFYKLGYTTHEELGAKEGGIIGHLTAGKYTREDLTKASIIMALVHLERPELYK